MTIGICDDSRNARELLAGYIHKYGTAHKVVEFADGKSVLDYVKYGGSVDVLFLDIDFRDELDGMAVAERLKEKQIRKGNALASLPLIVFVTGMPERMPEAFGVHAFQFITKPIDERRFGQIFAQAVREAEAIAMPPKEQNLVLQIGVSTNVIPVSQIYFMETNGRKVRVHLQNRVLDAYGKLADIVQAAGEDFFQIHRSFAVNMAYIFNYERTQVELSDGTQVPMSKYKYKDFIQAYMERLGG